MSEDLNQDRQPISREALIDDMERRWMYMYSNDLCNGQDAGEYDVLETGIADAIIEDDDLEEAATASESVAEKAGGGGGVSRPVARSPRLLTGGFPCSPAPEAPILPGAEVHQFSHGGYDGGVVVGFEGTWNPQKFAQLVDILDAAKEEAGDAMREDAMEGFPLNLDGTEILVSPKGGRAGGDDAKGGVVYKYRFHCQGVEFLIHSNPSRHIQPGRVRYATIIFIVIRAY
jgi:hypothetical protein